MGFLDDAKDKAQSLREKAERVAEEHSDTIKQGLEKAEDAIGDRLSPERREQAGELFDKAGEMVDRIADDEPADQPEERERP